jgi:hypothetical protein
MYWISKTQIHCAAFWEPGRYGIAGARINNPYGRLVEEELLAFLGGNCEWGFVNFPFIIITAGRRRILSVTPND